MGRIVLTAVIAAILASAALLFGLTSSALRTGRIDPLDWVVPCAAAILCLMLLQHRRLHRDTAGAGAIPSGGLGQWVAGGWTWGLVTIPCAVLLADSAGRAPVAGMAVLAISLAIVAAACVLTERQNLKARLLTYGFCAVLSVLVSLLPATWLSNERNKMGDADRPKVAVFTALPLQGVAFGAAHRIPAAEAIGLRSALWRVLEEKVRLQPLDSLEREQLADADVVLLAQPRLLSPEELVAFDAWVREGGKAVILADPLLHWPDTRPLADPARAPLTSLLDPLLTHWGLRLESAELDVGEHQHGSDEIDRWMLGSGGMLQLSGASRFTFFPNSSCIVAEEGLVARCDIGNGQALLVADADWIDDMLWTMAPDTPADRRQWTSDAPDVLASWLVGEARTVSSRADWLVDQDSLLGAVRASLLLILLFSCGWAFANLRPKTSQSAIEVPLGQKRYKGRTNVDHP